MNIKYRRLKGTRDILLEEAERWRWCEERWQEILERYGYGEIRTPIIEPVDLFLRSVGDHFLQAYVPIAEARRDTQYGERERHFQLYRRGRYVEFNLVYDRGTLFGLQTGGRTESILMSLPPVVHFQYDRKETAGSEEARLYEYYLQPKDWI